MLICTCAMRGPETCPRHRAHTSRSIAALDPVTARALALSRLAEQEPVVVQVDCEDGCGAMIPVEF